MNEVEIRARLRGAVGEARYPTYLTSHVEARLRNPERESSASAIHRRDQSRWLVGIGRSGALAAPLLVVLLMAALVVGAHMWRAARPIPEGVDPAIPQYQSMVGTDHQRFTDVPSYNCLNWTDPKCVPAVEALTPAMQQWLNDLNRSHPPARFTAVDALMRRHLELAIAANNDSITAFRTRNAALWNSSGNTLNSEGDALGRLATDVVASSQGTIASHTSAVRSDRAYLLACALCQRLLSQDQVSCPTGETPSCADEIAEVRLQVETFQSDLVFDITPESLAAEDARLQADLSSADVALSAMENALSAGDAAGLQAGLDALRQALGRVESDAADLAASN